MGTAERSQLSPTEFEAMRDSDLAVLIAPYLVIGVIILSMLLLIRMVKMPKSGDHSQWIDFLPTLKRSFSIRHYRGRCTDYVLDFHYPIWYPSVCLSRDE